MSICTPCLNTKPVPACSTLLTIGTIADIDTAVAVYVWDITTGQIIVFDTTTSGTGEVSIDLSEVAMFVDHAYEITVTLANASLHDNELIAIDGEQKEIVCVRFVDVKATDGTLENYAEATLILS